MPLHGRPILTGALLMALLTGFAAAATTADMHGWIGHVAPPWPAGVEYIGGSCIPAGGALCAFTTTLLRAGEQRWFALSRALPAPESDQPLRQVLDVIPVAPVPPGFTLAWGTCRAYGRAWAGIVAIVRYDADKPFLGDSMWARRVDIVAERFQTAPLEAVDCVNIGMGE